MIFGGESGRFVAACVQMNSGDSVAANLREAAALCAQAADAGARLIVLPEFFALMSADENLKISAAEKDGDGEIQNALAAMARASGAYIVGGTVPLRCEDDPARVWAACPLYAPDGTRAARYDKMHLFHFKGTNREYAESNTIAAGAQVVTAQTPLGIIGLSVCYDLRFPELYRAMSPPPDIIVAPSAFTVETGQAHWQLLLQARAVENLAYMLGAAQAGTHPGGRTTYGNSMVVDAWGNIAARADVQTAAVIVAEIDGERRDSWRQRLPALKNRRLKINSAGSDTDG